jgi:uncharacterized protein (TIGR01319 family)
MDSATHLQESNKMNKYDFHIIDIGSTYTKQRLFKNSELVATVQSPTTIDNVYKGIKKGLDLMKEGLEEEKIDAEFVLSSSSAAGGLRMVAIGFMMRVTAKAAKEVAMNSGSKILEILSNEDPADFRVQVLKEISPDIILLAGGTDGGDEKSIIENAELIVASETNAVVVIAGNLNAQRKVAKILKTGNINHIRVPNIMPTIHELRVKEAREAIHMEFIKEITKAEGLNALRQVITNDKIIPTPGAVLMAAELLAKGTYKTEGIGELIIVDLGGATTDIHSVIPQMEELDAEERGLVVTNEKQMSYRTVEGNLGLRISAVGIIDAVDSRIILEKRNLNTAEMVEEFEEYCEMVEENPSYLPLNEKEEIFDTLLAETAVEVALKRHAGRYASEVDTFKGYITGMPIGRDLRNVDLVIGVGGIFSHNDEEKSKAIIREALKDRNMSLLPKNPKIIIDKDYLLFAAGNIMEEDKDYAMEVLRKKFMAKK